LRTLKRTALLALTALLVGGLSAPADARPSVPTARQRRAAARAKRVQIAAQIDTLKASDRELEDTVHELDAGIDGQEASVAAARQAAAAAEEAVAESARQLTEAERALGVRREAVVRRAVDAYTQPEPVSLTEVLTSKDLNEASRKKVFLDDVVVNDRTEVDRMRAAEEDLTAGKARLESATRAVRTRRRQAEQRLAELQAARREQARLRTALNERIKEFVEEADLVASEEDALEKLIRDADLTTPVAPDDGGGNGGGGNGGSVSGSGLIWPASGPVTSGFGRRWGRLHAGIDIGAGYGAPIRAAKSGVVVFSGWMNGYGNAIVINHGGGFSTLYGHQSRRVASQGQHVSQGQVIGYVGSTGHSTGPHLHFETRVNGSPQNPRRYL
jgi:murein DD-endopeptidase MepM/ murein hydrolase activator NlpD